MANIQEIKNSIERIKEDSSNSNTLIQNGIVFKREEIGGKVRYSYTIYLDGKVTEQGFLEDLAYAHTQLENLIVGKKVEDKLAIIKAQKLDE